MNNLCTDIGYMSLNKWGEQLCGDRVEIVDQGENSTVIVLADGMGSGVKANILSSLTSKIISTMMAANMRLEDCVSTIASTLPVCAPPLPSSTSSKTKRRKSSSMITPCSSSSGTGSLWRFPKPAPRSTGR